MKNFLTNFHLIGITVHYYPMAQYLLKESPMRLPTQKAPPIQSNERGNAITLHFNCSNLSAPTPQTGQTKSEGNVSVSNK